jgi:hypothetical protein
MYCPDICNIKYYMLSLITEMGEFTRTEGCASTPESLRRLDFDSTFQETVSRCLGGCEVVGLSSTTGSAATPRTFPGQETGSGDYQPDHADHDFLTMTFDEVKGTPCTSRARIIRGPLHRDLTDTLRTALSGYYTERPLCDITPANLLKREIFATEIALGPTPGQLEQSKRVAIEKLMGTKSPRLMGQEIPSGLLMAPELHHQEQGEQDCVATCFHAVFEDIAEEEIDTQTLSRVISSSYDSITMHDEGWLKVLTSKAFAERYNKTIQVVSLMGADLYTIKALATGMSNGLSDPKIHCIVSLLNNSEPAVTHGAWHCDILLSADKRHVTINDPTNFTSDSGSLILPKTDFLRFWGQAYMRTHIIVSEPKWD